MELWHDTHANCDLWIEHLPEPVAKPITAVRLGDVEIDDDSRIVYRSVAAAAEADETVNVIYDALYSDGVTENSLWRQDGEWSRGLIVTVHAQVVYLITEEEFL